MISFLLLMFLYFPTYFITIFILLEIKMVHNFQSFDLELLIDTLSLFELEAQVHLQMWHSHH